MKMPFGKHKEKELTEIPKGYLRWLRQQEWLSGGLAQAVDEALGLAPTKPRNEPWQPSEGEPWGPSMNDLLGSFTVRQSGSIGQEILDQDGTVVAWTTDAWLAQVVCKLLNDNEELLRRKEEKDGTR